MRDRPPFFYPGMTVPFVLLVTCFAAWGIAANMTDPLVNVFSKIFSMSALQSAFVQFAYYGAYFLLALPAAFVTRRYSYKTGVLLGLGLAAVGAFMFYPASLAMSFGPFLAALFVLAAGLSVLETSANPFVIAMGPEANATRRLNFAQAFNPVGTNIGVFLAATLILPQLNPASEAERAAMAPEQLERIQQAELGAVMTPYVGMACLLVVIWIGIALSKVPRTRDEEEGISAIDFGPTLKRLAGNPHYRFGVIAQFFNVAAQTCAWTFTIQYAQSAIGASETEGGAWLQASLIVFLVSRFAMTVILAYVRPSALLLAMALLGTGLSLYAVLVPGLSGVIAVVALSLCLSLMFPTIYGIALEGLGEDTKFGAAGLVMAILGGALLPLVHGAMMDAYGATTAYGVPAACFLVVAAYGAFDLATDRRRHRDRLSQREG
ncbi:L-fucose:H+ symporter permease [Fulvimarina endophytica]|uniref:L-fucose:H+ symporter permease n=1 Tax=Fulvimarina endophytica TaxID=2293836 RepID=A0A371WYN8_9HYPH|nr:L-fucose:H+ symporter permease [Fulvimarina endophytica]RFC62082.1 L-fucose:H+ symporter permease [Fulvimarina endophytica]